MKIFQRVTRKLGNELRFLRDTCTGFTTKELRHEAECCRQKEACAAPSNTATMSSTTNDHWPKMLNLNTYKLHALGDYPSPIKLFGTTDSFSTQLVCQTFFSCMERLLRLYWQGELEHQTSKSRYARTSRKMFLPQLASIKRRQAHIHCIHAQREAWKRDDPTLDMPDQHHFIGRSQNFPEDISIFVQKNSDDPAIEVSLPT